MHTKRYVYQTEQLRNQLIQAIDLLLETPEKYEAANQILDKIHSQSFKKEKRFSLTMLVFSPFAQMLRVSHIQKEVNTLIHIKKQLLGEKAYTNIHAYKCNFVDFLSEEMQNSYYISKKLLYTQKDILETGEIKIFSEEYIKLRSRLIAVRDDFLPENLPTMLLLNVITSLLSVSYVRSPYFDIQDNFSTYFPVSSMESLEKYLSRIENFLQKIEGMETLFVNIYLLPDGFVINLQ